MLIFLCIGFDFSFVHRGTENTETGPHVCSEMSIVSSFQLNEICVLIQM